MMQKYIEWVTRPERPKDAKDEVKRPEGPPARSRGPEGPKTSRLKMKELWNRIQDNKIEFFQILTFPDNDFLLDYRKVWGK